MEMVKQPIVEMVKQPIWCLRFPCVEVVLQPHEQRNDSNKHLFGHDRYSNENKARIIKTENVLIQKYLSRRIVSQGLHCK